MSIKKLSAFLPYHSRLPEQLIDAIDKKANVDDTYREYIQNFISSSNRGDRKYSTVYFRDTIALPHRELFETDLDWHNAWIPIDSAMLHYSTDLRNRHKIEKKLQKGGDALFIKGDNFFQVSMNGKNKYEYKAFESEGVYFESGGENYLNKVAWEGNIIDLLDEICKEYPSHREIDYYLDTDDLHNLYKDHKIYKVIMALKEDDIDSEKAIDRILDGHLEDAGSFDYQLNHFIENLSNPNFKEEITPDQEVLKNAQILGMKKHISSYIKKGDLKEVAIFIKWNEDKVSTDDVPEQYRDAVEKLIKNREPIKLATSENNTTAQKKAIKL